MVFYQSSLLDDVLVRLFLSADIIRGEEKRMRINITLACQECKRRNYITSKNKKNTPDRIEIKKYCKFCKKETMHKETK